MASDLKNWLEPTRPKLNFREMAKLSKKKIQQGVRIRKNANGNPVISSRKKYIDLSNYIGSPDRYENDLEVIINGLRPVLINPDMKDSYINFKFCDSDKVCNMSHIHFLFNMIIWLPLFALSIPITRDKVFMPKDFNNKSYIKYVDEQIIEPYKHLATHNELSKLLARSYNIFIRVTEIYGIDLGLTFSLHDLIKKWDDPEIYEICHTQIPDGLQISEAEEYVNKQTKRLIEIMLTDPNDNVLKPLLRSGQGINPKQLKEFCVSTAWKPDLYGNTIAIKPISNLVTDGLRDIRTFTVDALGGRKAAVLALEIDNSGYLARMFSKLTANIHLHPDPSYDCGSDNYYEFKINDEIELSDMRGRWYLTEKGTLRQLLDTDFHMIGKTLNFRSPVMCASKDGICKYCYGHLYEQNIHINIGINSALKISERYYQNTLSAKHVLNTRSEMLDFGLEFDNYMVIDDGYKIKFREDIEDYEYLEVWINKYMILKDADVEDLSHNEYVNEFIIYNTDTDEKIVIKDVDGSSVYLADKIFKIFSTKRKKNKADEEGWIRIPLADLEADDEAFFIRLKNDELTKPLKELKSLIEKGKELEVSNASELITHLKYLLKCGGIDIESIHIEIVARNLVRDAEDVIKLPDWSVENPPYQITSVHNGILMSSSVINSLTFERLRQQLKSDVTYRKTDTSPYDRLFILD